MFCPAEWEPVPLEHHQQAHAPENGFSTPQGKAAGPPPGLPQPPDSVPSPSIVPAAQPFNMFAAQVSNFGSRFA